MIAGEFSAEDVTFMRYALRQAMRGLGRTCPNPPVGAVVARGGVVVGAGFHPKAGEPHAEVFALRAAGEKARGAALYVTLEPCCHTGRTPPCTEAILESGVREVVFAMNDPSPHCNGGGERCLCAAGVPARKGPCAAEAAEIMAPFLKRLKLGLPLVTAKWAMSLDGKTATRTGDSKWISCPETLGFAHRLRSRAGAVLVGVSTVLKDDPLLTCRVSCASQPIRVVADTGAKTPPGSKLAKSAAAYPVIVAHAPGAAPARIEALKSAGVITAAVRRAEGGGIDLDELLRGLAAGAFGPPPVDHVLLEGGGTLASAAFEAGLVDRVAAVISPRIIGGSEAVTPAQGRGVELVSESIGLMGLKTRRMGEDVVLEARIAREGFTR